VTGAIAWYDFSWEAFATLFTGLAAVLAAFAVGWRQGSIQKIQAEIQKRQTELQEFELRSDLFDRRYRVFEKVERFLAEILQNADDPKPETQREYCIAIGEARFLFKPHVHDGLQEILGRWARFHALKVTMKHSFDAHGHYGDGNPDKECKAMLWFSERFTSLPDLFDELRLSTPVNE
jgi:hypothetical protein